MFTRLVHPARPIGRFAVGSTARSQPLSSSSTRFANRIYNPVRSPSELEALLLVATSSRRPLITLWTASWCASCRAVRPAVRSLLEEPAGSTDEGTSATNVSFVEVELDAPDNAALGMRYMITSVPTLLAFRRQEALLREKVTDVVKMKDPAFMRKWIQDLRDDPDGGGNGASLLSGLFRKR